MKTSATIYHNPRCSKSRQTLELLQAHGVEITVVAYLDTPPDKGQLRQFVAGLGNDPRSLMRRGEPRFRELGLDDPALDDEALIAAMHEHPILMERPLVVTARGVALGRPPENVLAILS